MIKITLAVMLGERKLRIADLARETGVNRGTLTRLYYETAERIDLDALEAICTTLNCSVGDLLVHVPEPAEKALVSSASRWTRPCGRTSADLEQRNPLTQ